MRKGKPLFFFQIKFARREGAVCPAREADIFAAAFFAVGGIFQCFACLIEIFDMGEALGMGSANVQVKADLAGGDIIE